MRTPRRVQVIGTCGSGKSTLASALAVRWGLRHIELDALFHEPNWVEAPYEVFRQRIEDALKTDSWIVDGNYYRFTSDLVLSRADLVVWLDYSLTRVMTRLLLRTARRLVLREALWNGNRESLRVTLSKESILLWALKTHKWHRNTVPRIMNEPHSRHIRLVHLRSPKETERWLKSLRPATKLVGVGY